MISYVCFVISILRRFICDVFGSLYFEGSYLISRPREIYIIAYSIPFFALRLFGSSLSILVFAFAVFYMA